MISTGIKSDETLLKTKRFASYGFFSGKSNLYKNYCPLFIPMYKPYLIKIT